MKNASTVSRYTCGYSCKLKSKEFINKRFFLQYKYYISVYVKVLLSALTISIKVYEYFYKYTISCTVSVNTDLFIFFEINKCPLKHASTFIFPGYGYFISPDHVTLQATQVDHTKAPICYKYYLKINCLC